MEKSEKFIEKEVRDLARRIAKERLVPTAGDRDKNGTFPRDAIEALGDSGLLGVVVSEKFGGMDASRKALRCLQPKWVAHAPRRR